MKVYALLVILLALSVPVSAQETETPASTAEPEPAAEFIVNQFMELVSIETMRSAFTLTPPAVEIEQATLNVTQEGWSGETVSLNLVEDAAFIDPYTEFVYLWRVNPENPPILFRDITFTWTFRLRSDESAEVTLTMPYADPRDEWAADENPQGRIKLAVQRDRLKPESMRQPLQQIYDLISENTGGQTRLGVVFFDSTLPLNPCNNDGTITASASGAEVPCNFDTIRAIYEASGYTPIESGSTTVESVEHYVAELLFDAMYTPLWQGKDVPAWFRYGLQQFYIPREKLGLLQQSRHSVRINRAIQDMSVVPTDSERLALWQAQSYGMVQYMAEQIGVPALFEIARSISEEQPLQALYETESGQPFTAIIPAWSNWIFTRAADNAYLYTPYLPPTLTPTLTRTRTPTFTPTLSPTVTLTITLSETVGITPSPFPTDTATFTRTPTVTPRPLSSLFTPTPEPIEGVATGDNTSILIGGGLIGMGIIGLIALLLFSRPGR
jgi:hypothetical protein